MAIKATNGADRSPRIRMASMVCAGMIVLMLLAQLYSFEDFGSVLGGIIPVYDQFVLAVLAAAIVFVELLSLPYLLNMFVSPLMRYVSAASAIATGAFWLISALTNAHAANSGVFSTAYELPGGLVAAVWSMVVVCLLAAVVSSDSRFRHDGSS